MGHELELSRNPSSGVAAKLAGMWNGQPGVIRIAKDLGNEEFFCKLWEDSRPRQWEKTPGQHDKPRDFVPCGAHGRDPRIGGFGSTSR
jgi:hypothetical protein